MNNPRLRRQSDIEYLKGDKFKQPQVGETWFIQISKTTGHLVEYRILEFTDKTVRVCSSGGTVYIYLKSMIWFIERVKPVSDVDTVSVEKLFFNKE